MPYLPAAALPSLHLDAAIAAEQRARLQLVEEELHKERLAQELALQRDLRDRDLEARRLAHAREVQLQIERDEAWSREMELRRWQRDVAAAVDAVQTEFEVEARRVEARYRASLDAENAITEGKRAAAALDLAQRRAEFDARRPVGRSPTVTALALGSARLDAELRSPAYRYSPSVTRRALDAEMDLAVARSRAASLGLSPRGRYYWA